MYWLSCARDMVSFTPWSVDRISSRSALLRLAAAAATAAAEGWAEGEGAEGAVEGAVLVLVVLLLLVVLVLVVAVVLVATLLLDAVQLLGRLRVPLLPLVELAGPLLIGRSSG